MINKKIEKITLTKIQCKQHLNNKMSSAYQTMLMLQDFKKADCRNATANFIKCKLGKSHRECKNFDDICKRVCNGESSLHDIVIVEDTHGNIYARDLTMSYVRHSER